MKPQNEDPKDDVRLIVTNLEEAPEEEEIILDDDEDEIVEESIIEDDDVPVAVTVDEAIQSKRSGWRLFSSEDLPQLTLREILGGDYLLGSVPEPFDVVAADVNVDGSINISDVTSLIDLLLTGK